MTGERQRDREASAADHVLAGCGGLKAGEKVVVIGDEKTAEIAALFAARAGDGGADVCLCRVETAAMHGSEPGPDVARAMLQADLIVGLSTMSLAHTQARHAATMQGARYLSLPDYSWALLADPSLQVDFAAAAPEVQRIAERLSAGAWLHVSSPAGTDIEIDVAGRKGNACPGCVLEPGTLGSPPDIEANIAPRENGSNGRIVVDGSIPCREIGLLGSPVELTVVDGRITGMAGDAKTAEILERMFETAGPSARVLAECGIGLNRAARLQGNMLTDEGAFGCVHFGFGSNATIGGTNHVAFHLDFVCRQASLSVDGDPVMSCGELVA